MLSEPFSVKHICFSSVLWVSRLPPLSPPPPPPAGSETLQSGHGLRGVLLPALEEEGVQVAGQPAHLYPLPLLRLPGHAHLLRAAGLSDSLSASPPLRLPTFPRLPLIPVTVLSLIVC